MRKFFLLLFPIFLLANCTKDSRIVLFEMNYPNRIFEIPAGLSAVESFHVKIDNIQSEIDNYLANRNITKEDVSSILPGEFVLSSLDGTPLDFMYEVSVRIHSNTNPNVEKEIFYDDRVYENTGATLSLIPNENDLSEILYEDFYSLDIGLIRLRDTPNHTVEMRFDLKFNVY